MAWSFTSGSSQYLEIDSTPVTSVPLSMGCWFKRPSSGSFHVFMFVGDASEPDQSWRLGVDSVAQQLFAQAYQGSSSKALSTIAVSDNVWQHGLAVFKDNDTREVWLDGGSYDTVTTGALTPSGVDRIAIAAARDSTPNYYTTALIAEAAIWNVALTTTEALMLAKGFSPLFIKPANLVAYWPLVRSLNDHVGGYNLTAYNSPTVANHPPKIFYSFPVEVAAPMQHSWNCDVEEGDFSDFDSTETQSGNMSVSAAAALGGTSYGIQWNIAAGNMYGRLDFSAVSSNVLRLRFYIDPNTSSIDTATSMAVQRSRCDGTLSGITTMAAVNLMHSGTDYTLRPFLRNDSNGQHYGGPYAITDEPHYCEMKITRSTGSTDNNGTCQFWIDGTLQWSKTDWDNYDLWPTLSYEELVCDFAGVNTGILYTDEFVVNDTGDPIGPVAPYQIVHFLDTPVDVSPGTTGSWQPVDVATLVPAGASGVLVELINQDNTNIDYAAGLRKTGSSDNRFQDIHEDSHRMAWVGVNDARSFDAYIEHADVLVILHGYFDGQQVKFLTTAQVYNNTANATYETFDIASATGSDVATFAFFETVTGGNNYYYMRNYSSSDTTLYQRRRNHDWSIVGIEQVSTTEVFKAATDDYTVTNYYLVGYVTSDRAVFYDTPTDLYSSLVIDTYQDLPALPTGAIGGVYAAISPNDDVDERFDFRKNGSTRTSQKSSNVDLAYYASACDSNRIVEAFKSYAVATGDLYEVGYFLGPAGAAGETLSISFNAVRGVRITY